MNVASIARSGMLAAQSRMDASAANIANAGTAGYRRQQVVQASAEAGGVAVSAQRAAQPGSALATDLIQQRAAAYEFKANLRVLQTGQETLGSLLDTRA